MPGMKRKEQEEEEEEGGGNGIWILLLSFISYLTLGVLFNRSESHFFHLWNDIDSWTACGERPEVAAVTPQHSSWDVPGPQEAAGGSILQCAYQTPSHYSGSLSALPSWMVPLWHSAHRW